MPAVIGQEHTVVADEQHGAAPDRHVPLFEQPIRLEPAIVPGDVHRGPAATGRIGGPLNSTDVVLTYTWKQAFEAPIDFAYGAALSFMIAAVVAVISLVEFRFARQQEST